jgi:hypothetical protein
MQLFYHKSCTRQKKNARIFPVGKHEEKRLFVGTNVDGKVILKWMLKK